MTTIIFAPELESALTDDAGNASIRALLINPDDELLDYYTPRAAAIERPRFTAMIAAMTTDDRSTLMLALSLCPLHSCDYAICFDDDDPECESIRACFPEHDS